MDRTLLDCYAADSVKLRQSIAGLSPAQLQVSPEHWIPTLSSNKAAQPAIIPSATTSRSIIVTVCSDPDPARVADSDGWSVVRAATCHSDYRNRSDLF